MSNTNNKRDAFSILFKHELVEYARTELTRKGPACGYGGGVTAAQLEEFLDRCVFKHPEPYTLYLKSYTLKT
jgi:DNA-directed RNA polymerase III subunit RPC1